MQERRIKIQVGDVEVTALLNGCATADLVWDALPIISTGSTWGDEVYFRTDLTADEQDSEAVVDMGAVAFWPPGQAICLFYGLTPMSTGDEIRPASPVNVIGQIEGDPTVLKSASGSDVRVERV
ncbi:MAG: cyclophilin-like fold protein [SAR202 cluster bacterium]|nr:cyclophilin-like fold protein [SAR202 cluster bacterium]